MECKPWFQCNGLPLCYIYINLLHQLIKRRLLHTRVLEVVFALPSELRERQPLPLPCEGLRALTLLVRHGLERLRPRLRFHELGIEVLADSLPYGLSIGLLHQALRLKCLGVHGGKSLFAVSTILCIISTESDRTCWAT